MAVYKGASFSGLSGMSSVPMGNEICVKTLSEWMAANPEQHIIPVSTDKDGYITLMFTHIPDRGSE